MQLNFDNPQDIDCDPAELSTPVIEQLAVVAPAIRALAQDSYRMLRTSFLTRIYDAAPEIASHEAVELWDNSTEGSQAARARGAAEAFEKVVSQMQTGHKAPL